MRGRESESRKSDIPRCVRRDPRPTPVTLTIHPRTRVLARGQIVMGGAPWRLGRVPESCRGLLLRLASGQPVSVSERDSQLALELVDRGLVLPTYAKAAAGECTIVIPAFENPEQLDRCLGALSGRHRIIVVDDASGSDALMRAACLRHGAEYVAHESNRGPAAARNTGLVLVDTEFVAFLDSDCLANTHWIDALMVQMADPRVAVVAPRVMHLPGNGIVDRFESTDAALDMGSVPELVAPGSSLGYLPTAAWLARKSALGEAPFDESLRTGEDVDAVWRIIDAGWSVRYASSTVIHHAGRQRLRELLTRRVQYGESSAELSSRYPERLVPARISATSMALAFAVATGRPLSAAAAVGYAVATVGRSTGELPDRMPVTGRLTLLSVAADARAVGALLRRECWPIGAACLALAPRSRTARLGAAVMLVPVVHDWHSRRSPLDPVTYAALRVLADAAYGTGVIKGAVRMRHARTLLPRLRRSGAGSPRRRIENG